MDIREKVFRSPFPFDAEMQLKREIADWFARDGSDLLEIFSMGWKSGRNNLSYRSKLFINLRMAIECYLKALIIVYSLKTESPEDAYEEARKASHGVGKLLAKVQSRFGATKKLFRKASNELIAQADGMNVSLRYEVNLTAALAKETFSQQMFETGPMSGTIGSDEWMLVLCGHAKYIGGKTRKAFSKVFGKHQHYTGTDAMKLSKRREQFIAKV